MRKVFIILYSFLYYPIKFMSICMSKLFVNIGCVNTLLSKMAQYNPQQSLTLLKYKCKIERKIDALLTITDTYVHTYISTNLNTSSVVECFSTAAAIVIVVVIFRILCCLKENVLKACLVLLSTAHTFMTHRHTHNRRHIVLQYFRCLCAFIPVELRV